MFGKKEKSVLAQKFQEARFKEEREQKRRAKEERIFWEEIRRKEKQFTKIREKYLIPATVHDYKRWLFGYLESGGDIRYVRDRPFPNDKWFVAQEPFEMIALYGAMYVNIISFGDQITCGQEGFGHCQIYMVNDGYYTLNGAGAELFSDIDL